MKQKKIEGSIFLVPLLNGGYTLGLVARHYKHGTLFYFFKEKYATKIEKIPIEAIRKDNILWVKQGGDGAFIKHTWPILGVLPKWDKDEWPIPVFKTKDILKGFPIAVFLDERLEEIDRKRITEKEAKQIKWKNGIAGTGYIEEELSELLYNSFVSKESV